MTKIIETTTGRVIIKKESAQRDSSQFHRIEHPSDDDRGDLLWYYNELTGVNAYHSRCLRLKTDCTVNLGYSLINKKAIAKQETAANEAAEKALMNVNDQGQSLTEVLARVILDYETTGNGYLEIVRGKGGLVQELYFCPAVQVFRRPKGEATAYLYVGSDGAETPYPAFNPNENEPNSLLCLTNYTQNDKYYGLPDWRGCIVDIELDYYAALYNQKFFLNSGIPDMVVVVEGGEFDKTTESNVVTFFQAQLKGVNNAHRTLYLPINNPDVKVRFEKLGMERDKEGSFDKLRDKCRDNIISAHGVPPRLLGVVVAGQLGGGGEIQGQLKTFQETVITPRQSLIESKLNPVLAAMGLNVEIQFNELDVDIDEPASTYYPSMTAAGIIEVNEAREELGMNPLAAPKPQESPENSKTGLRLIQSLENVRKAL
jgi:HK97 family phage portal protein